MNSKFKLTSIALLTMAMQPAISNETAEDWNAPKTAAMDIWDEDLSIEELQAIEDMKLGGTTYWLFTAASGATPYTGGYTYNYGGAGCMNAVGNGGVAWFDQNINIPDGHTITFMRFYYNDADAADTTEAQLYLMDGAGGFTSLETRISNTDTGFDSVGASMSYDVDNTVGALVLRYTLRDNASAEPCGVRFVVSSN